VIEFQDMPIKTVQKIILTLTLSLLITLTPYLIEPVVEFQDRPMGDNNMDNTNNNLNSNSTNSNPNSNPNPIPNPNPFQNQW
jgi:hypothetical protein